MVIDVAVVLHNAAPRRTYHFFLNLGYYAVVAGSCVKVRNIDLQLRQIHYRPGRRLHALREIDGLIEKFPQKAVFFRAYFTNDCVHLFPHSARMMGCRMTVFHFSGLHRRTSLK